MENKFLTNSLSTRFEKHLELSGNSRIIFSGPFGIGKTTFLHSFFESNRQYFYIKLNPVNYSLATNEDIFDLIKYDILLQLWKMCLVEENKSDFGINYLLPFFLTNQTVTTKAAIKFTKTGKALLEIVELIEKTREKYQQYKGLINADPDFEKIKKYLGDKIDVLFLYEDDFVTKAIREIIQKINKNGLKTVLIIDDLDRIDPEHIFRLFNVFSAHLGWKNTFENKFDFEKVIFVCDMSNVRSIFATKYGINTDFNGYIDKFYSVEIFEFGNTDIILRWMMDRLEQKKHFVLQTEARFLADLLAAFLRRNLVNVRSLEKISMLRNPSNRLNTQTSFFQFARVYDLLIQILGSKEELLTKVKKLGDFVVTMGNTPVDRLFHQKRETYLNFFIPFLGGETRLKERYTYVVSERSSGNVTYELMDSNDRLIARQLDSTVFDTGTDEHFLEVLVDCIHKAAHTVY